MTAHLDREIATTGSSVVPIDFLQSIFVAELIHPSSCLWISSPWISNIEMIDNRARQFGSLCPDWSASRIRLIQLLEALLERGAQITIIVNDSPHNNEFVSLIQPLCRIYASELRIIRSPELHEKGIVGDWFSLTGSMNLTYNGVYVNQEHLAFTCNRERVVERRLSFQHRWDMET